ASSSRVTVVSGVMWPLVSSWRSRRCWGTRPRPPRPDERAGESFHNSGHVLDLAASRFVHLGARLGLLSGFGCAGTGGGDRICPGSSGVSPARLDGQHPLATPVHGGGVSAFPGGQRRGFGPARLGLVVPAGLAFAVVPTQHLARRAFVPHTKRSTRRLGRARTLGRRG